MLQALLWFRLCATRACPAWLSPRFPFHGKEINGASWRTQLSRIHQHASQVDVFELDQLPSMSDVSQLVADRTLAAIDALTAGA